MAKQKQILWVAAWAMNKVVSEYPNRTQRAAVCLSSYGKSEPKENEMSDDIEFKDETLDVRV